MLLMFRSWRFLSWTLKHQRSRWFAPPWQWTFHLLSCFQKTQLTCCYLPQSIPRIVLKESIPSWWWWFQKLYCVLNHRNIKDDIKKRSKRFCSHVQHEISALPSVITAVIKMCFLRSIVLNFLEFCCWESKIVCSSVRFAPFEKVSASLIIHGRRKCQEFLRETVSRKRYFGLQTRSNFNNAQHVN